MFIYLLKIKITYLSNYKHNCMNSMLFVQKSTYSPHTLFILNTQSLCKILKLSNTPSRSIF